MQPNQNTQDDQRHALLRSGRRIPELDGLRGIAIFLILIYHCITLPNGERWPNPLAYIKFATRLTWTGVDLFFVLSGFLIGGILLNVRESPNYFRVFYFRRVCRILPAYFAYLLVVVLCYRYFYPHFRIQWYVLFEPTMPWYSYLTFTQNFWMAARNNAGGFVIALTWSLCVEEQFYLTLPAVIRWVSLRKLPYLLASGILIAPLLRLALLLRSQDYETAVHVFLLCRMDTLLLGVLLAFLLVRPEVWRIAKAQGPWLWVLLAVLCLGMAYFNKTKPASLSMLVVGYSWFAFFYATIMVIALTQTRSLLARFLRNRWLMRLGAIAYGTYLIHVVVFAIVMTLVRKHANVYWTVGDLTASLLSIALSIGIAQISWVIYEKRFVRWGRKLQY